MENLVKTGGFALICAKPGLGKSKILQILDHRLESLGNVKVGVMQRPQSSVADFYREMGDLFGSTCHRPIATAALKRSDNAGVIM